MKKFNVLAISLACAALCGASACAAKPGGPSMGNLNFELFAPSDNAAGGNQNYQFGAVEERPFATVGKNPSCFFSLDANTATYSYVRRQINYDCKVDPASVRVEEMINYFDYSYAEPTDEALAVSTYLSPCPWNADSKLLTVGVKTKYESISADNGNYVLLVDVSGSMSGDDRLGLAKKGFNLLVDGLGEGDVVSVVTYANGVKRVLDGAECTASGKETVKRSISALGSGGGTNGEGGLEEAYAVAKKHFITGGNNRVVLVSDGDFNAGRSSVDEMKEFIKEKAASGIYLTVIGVGMGNTRDDMLETLATCGNGNYAYLDNLTEAKRLFQSGINGTLRTVAKDAKAGVTFNDNVEKYRLIGYDTKIISEDEFNDVKKDAGELGSGLCSTAVYEIQLKDGAAGELAKAEIRYKDVRGGDEVSKTAVATVAVDTASCTDAEFAACVAEFGLILRESKFKANASLAAVSARLDALGEYVTADEFKAEFKALVLAALRSEKYENKKGAK